MNRISLCIVFFIFFTVHQVSAEVATPELKRGAQLIGIAGSNGFNPAFDQHIKGDLDKLLPQLKLLNTDATILIEVYYPDKSGDSKEQRISSAFYLAEQVQQYLKVRHNLDKAFFVAIRDNGAEKLKYTKVRLTTFPRDYFEN